jgi:hypothetical protein
MAMVSPEAVQKVKELFETWMELNDNKKQLGNQIKETIEEAAVVSDVKKTIIAKTFSYLKKKHESGMDELDEIVKCALEIEG